MIYIFDVDGVLIDNKRAVVEAYKLAGASFPEKAWGLPWYKWTTEEVHIRKHKYYKDCLFKYGRVLPLCYLAKKLDAPVLTMSSSYSIKCLFQLINKELPILGTSQTLQDKANVLNRLNDSAVYFDDNTSIVEALREMTNQHIVYVNTDTNLSVIHQT